MTFIDQNAALIVIDAQQGFDSPYWGLGNNPACEHNIEALIHAWHLSGRPLVVVTHNSVSPDSPLHPTNAGNALMPFVAGAAADAFITTINLEGGGFATVTTTTDILGWAEQSPGKEKSSGNARVSAAS